MSLAIGLVGVNVSAISLSWLSGGALFGTLLVGLALVAANRRDRRRRNERRERPPQSTKLLRPPGHSLRVRAQQLEDVLNDLTVSLVASGTLFGTCSVGCVQIGSIIWRMRGNFSDLLVPAAVLSVLAVLASALASGLWAIRCLRRIRATSQQRRACRFGLRGEQAVAEALADQSVARRGYRAFHDVPGDGAWNIDHVVVGPGGIYAVETKTRSRRAQPGSNDEHVVEYDGRTLKFPWCEDHRAVQQIKRNAEWLERLLKDFLPGGLCVRPILVVPGWYVKSLGKYPVSAMNANYLTLLLASEPGRFTSSQLAGATARLDQLCRDVEF